MGEYIAEFVERTARLKHGNSSDRSSPGNYAQQKGIAGLACVARYGLAKRLGKVLNIKPVPALSPAAATP